MSITDDPPWLIKTGATLWSLACSSSACWRLMGNPDDLCDHWCTTLLCAYCIIIHMRWQVHYSIAWFPLVHWLMGGHVFRRIQIRNRNSFFIIKNSCITRPFIGAYKMWCYSLRQLVQLLSVTTVSVCTTTMFLCSRMSHSIQVIVNISKTSARFSPSSFFTPPLEPIISVGSRVPALRSAAHNTGLCDALGCCLCLELSHLWRSHLPPWRYSGGNGQCANCVGMLREPYAVC